MVEDNKLSWMSILFVVTISMMLHIVALNAVLPVKIAGKSLWLFGLLACLVICSLYAVYKSSDKNYFLFLVISVIMFCLPVVIRNEVYGINMMEGMVLSRPVLLIPMMFLAGLYYLKDKDVLKITAAVIILTGFIQALIGILHKYVFPEIVTGAFAALEGKFFYVDSLNGPAYFSRESGSLANPAYYADSICLAAFVFAWFRPKWKRLPSLINFIGQMIFFSVLIVGILPSLNRLPILFTVIFTTLTFISFDPKRIIKYLVPISAFISIVIASVFTYYPQLIDRFLNLGFYGRAQKNELLINELCNSVLNFLIGIPIEIKSTLLSIENLGFGDNSYLDLVWTIGIPLTLAWFANLALFIRSKLEFKKSLLSWFFIVFVIVNYFIGDTIYADGWTFMLVICSCFAFGTEDYLINQSYNKK